MKTVTQLFVFILVLSFSFTISSQEPPPEIHVITLQVNTANLNKKNIDTYANFGQDDSITNRDYTIYARKGDIIIWKGVSSSTPSTDIVNIYAVKYVEGKNVFNRKKIKGNREKPELIVATVVKGTPGDEEKYVLCFKVFVNGKKKKGVFRIDPKIIVKH